MRIVENVNDESRWRRRLELEEKESIEKRKKKKERKKERERKRERLSQERGRKDSLINTLIDLEW